MMYKKLSNGISWVLHPFLLPLYLIVVLLTLTVFAHYPANVKFYLLWVVVLYAMIIPLLALGVLRSLGRISDFKVDNRRERLLPLLVGALYNIVDQIFIGWAGPSATCFAPSPSPRSRRRSSCASS